MSLSHEGEKAEGGGQWEEPRSRLSWAASLWTSCTHRSTAAVQAWLVAGCLHLWGQTGPSHGSGDVSVTAADVLALTRD